jgi:predicted transposase YbfD/YdcC
MVSSITIFDDIPDPRAANARHRLGDILVLAVASVLCGGETCVDFAQFARSKRAVMVQVLGDYAPPSHDTFSRVLRLLDPAALQTVFSRFAAAFAADLNRADPDRPDRDHPDRVVAIDGKAMRRAYETGLAASPPLMVTAFASQARLTLAAAMPGAGENEVEAALAVVACLDLETCIVSADALHCHKRMAAAVLERGGDYALRLKGNRSDLQRQARALLDADATADAPASVAETLEEGHGRRERTARVVPADGLGNADGFPGVAAVAEITGRRGASAPKTRLYLLSTVIAPERALAVVRAHWSIENSLHWSLDVVIGEEGLRSRRDNAPANIAILNRCALNIARAIDDPKTPIRRRFKRCAWEDDYLLNALAQMR